MVRPIYETEENKKRQNDMRSILESKWSCVLQDLPYKYQLDWMAFKDKKPMAVLEFKHREKLSFDAWPRYMISLDKWIRAREISQEMCLPFIMVITFTEGTYYGSFLHNESFDLSYMWGGRLDRNDAQDSEPMVLLPLKHFKKL